MKIILTKCLETILKSSEVKRISHQTSHCCHFVLLVTIGLGVMENHLELRCANTPQMSSMDLTEACLMIN